MIRDDRGVSDVVGYVLVFALITASIGTVFAAGLGGLDDRRQAEQVNNVERAFDVLHDNLRDIHRNDAPSRATELRLAGGTLSFADAVSVRVGEYNETESGWVDPANTTNATIRPVRYQSGATSYVVEGGALFRVDRGGETVVRPPTMVRGANRTALVFLSTRAASQGAIGGQTTARIVAERAYRSHVRTVNATEPDTHVRIEITSPRAAAWERYFERTDGFTVEAAADGSVAVSVETETVYVQRTPINVRFDR
ncbi:hypothetical protein GCM10027435_13540 [Haloparvum alkalitolerans]|uniref:DUF7289 family protein n=1 Tax=Haloparvum alkalitolerans TaxID=1042953 RepID=UPI003CF3143E